MMDEQFDLTEEDWEYILNNPELKQKMLDAIHKIKYVLKTTETMEEANIIFKNWKEFEERGII